MGVALPEKVVDALEEDGEQLLVLAPEVEVVDGHLGGELPGAHQPQRGVDLAVLALHLLLI